MPVAAPATAPATTQASLWDRITSRVTRRPRPTTTLPAVEDATPAPSRPTGRGLRWHDTDAARRENLATLGPVTLTTATEQPWPRYSVHEWYHCGPALGVLLVRWDEREREGATLYSAALQSVVVLGEDA